MKKIICLAASLLALALTPVFAQSPHVIEINNATGQPIVQSTPGLTKFNLDFPGGTPAALVRAIEKAMGKPLNAIIPTEDVDIQLPPLKMNDVVTPQLFAALEAASRKTVIVQYGGSLYGNGTSYTQQGTDYGFTTADSPVSDTSIWYFHAKKPSLPPLVSTAKICRFYSLAPYLDRGFTVDDITTAIQTGWKMAGINPSPELDYHKETRLLIAFGEPGELATIQSVLDTLPLSTMSGAELGAMKVNVHDLQQDVRDLKAQVQELTHKMSAAK